MAVREGLLALLDDGPRHGYQLKSEFEAATGGVWPLNIGQVYTTLDRLERDGLVEHDGDVARKVYRLTDDGEQALGAWWEAVGADNPPPRDELMLKVLMAIERGPDHALEVVTGQRTAALSLLQQRRQASRRDKDAGSLGATLVTDALMFRAEADLRWLDRCETRIEELRKESK
jgi:DNA-binding PadR family transcriptional regulator